HQLGAGDAGRLAQGRHPRRRDDGDLRQGAEELHRARAHRRGFPPRRGRDRLRQVPLRPGARAAQAGLRLQGPGGADMSDMIVLLERLIRVRTPNPGGDEIALAAALEDDLRTHAPDEIRRAEVARPGGPGAYVWARWGRPRLLVNVHIDTVPPNAGWT